MKEKAIIVSGYFNPLYKGHIEYLHKVLYYYSVIPGGNSLTQRGDIQEKHISNIDKIKAASRERLLRLGGEHER